MPSPQTSDFARDLWQAWAPPPRMSTAEWAEEYRYLSQVGSAEPGKYRLARAPYQRGMMDACDDPAHEIVVFRTSGQIGKSEVLHNFLGRTMHLDPCPILVIHPTGDAARYWSKHRLTPMLRDTPVLRDLMRDVRGIHSVEDEQTNTTLQKSFPGGILTIGGANSVANFRQHADRIFIGDDVDGWELTVGDEGDQVTLGMKRTATFWNRKTILASTPAEKVTSRIDYYYQLSDQRRFEMPCPHCLHFQALLWEHFHWEKNEAGEHLPATAHFQCVNPACRGRIEEHHKTWMLERGEWIAQNPGAAIAGFWLWEVYSPWKTWAKIVEEWLQAHAKGEEAERAFMNVTRGEAWEGKGDAPSWELIQKREEPYPQWSIPHPVEFLTAGIDVQDDRLEASVYGWGPWEECWCIGHQVLYGNTVELDVYEQLERWLASAWLQPTRNQMLGITLAAMDSGHRKDAVYAFVRRHAERVMATKGSSERAAAVVNKPTPQDINWRGEIWPQSVFLWTIGVSTIKQTLYGRLRIPEPGPRYIHFPFALGEEFYKQLTAEKLMTRIYQGRPYQEWLQTRPNEVLDCFVMSYAAAWVVGLPHMQWSTSAVGPTASTSPPPSPPPTPVAASRGGVGLMQQLLRGE